MYRLGSGWRTQQRSRSALPTTRLDSNRLTDGGAQEITSARHRFPKPVENYEVLNFFGHNIVASEGEEWKKIRKIVAPAFSDVSPLVCGCDAYANSCATAQQQTGVGRDAAHHGRHVPERMGRPGRNRARPLRQHHPPSAHISFVPPPRAQHIK